MAWRNGAPVRLTDIAEVEDSVQDLRNQGLSNGRPAVLVIIYKQPGANVIETADRVREVLPQLEAAIPQAINVAVAMERTTTIRASLREVERSLVIAMGLVIVVVFVFLRNLRATIIPAVAVPVSLVATFGVMYLCGYSLNNLSLMALTVATGFVVDDAIVVLENVTRHIEQGMSPFRAALRGAREVGFTVVSMSLSLIAAFIPILLMGGIVGRLFREFSITLSVAILVSLLVSLTATPDDVRAAPEARAQGRPRPPLPGERARLQRDAGRLPGEPGMDAAQSRAHHHRARRDHRPQRLPLHGRAQGILPAAGHRPDRRIHTRRPEHLLPGDAPEAHRLSWRS